MTAINDITGDKLVSKPTTNAYSENYDRIFGKDKVTEPQLYSSGIEIIIEAKDQEAAKNQLDQALKFFYKYYSQLFGVVDYGIISDSTPVEKE